MFSHSLGEVNWKVVFAALCLIMVVILGVIVSTPLYNETFVHADSVKGIGVEIYWDQACTNRTLSLNWEPIDPGTSINRTIYIRNEGTTASSLSMTTSNWTPFAASDYINLNWNYSGQIIDANQVIPLELTLFVSQDVIGITNFSFKIEITATNSFPQHSI